MDQNDLIIDAMDEISTGTKLYPKDIINHVLMVWATDYIERSPTAYNDGSDPNKPCDVVVVDVVDLDQVDEDTGNLGLVSRGAWWRQGRLIQRLKPRVGKPNPLVGRMLKGLGPNGAFELLDLSADEKALTRARNWWALSGGLVPSTPLNGKATTAPVTQVSAQSNPPPAPSPLEQAANASLGRSVTPEEQTVLDRLRRLGGDSDTPPF